MGWFGLTKDEEEVEVEVKVKEKLLEIKSADDLLCDAVKTKMDAEDIALIEQMKQERENVTRDAD